MKLRLQFTLLNTFLVLAVGAVVSLATFLAQRGFLVQKLESEQEEAARGFAGVCRQAVVTQNELLIASYLKHLAQSPGVSYAYFADPAGRIRAHTDPAFTYKPLEVWSESRPAPSEVERKVAVEVAGAPAGTARIGFKKSHLDFLVRQSVRELGRWILLAFAAAIGLGTLLALGLSAVMAAPIRRLAAGAREIGRGNFNVKVPPASAGEVGELARTFNQMAAELGKLDELKDEFISMVSHDLRAPLAAIISYADVLLEELRGPLNPTQREYLGTMVDNAKRLTAMVNDILDLAKMKAGKMEYLMRPVEVSGLLSRVQGLFKIAAAQQGTELALASAAGLRIRADEEKFERVLINLVSNAMKFVPSTGGRIRIEAVEKDGRVELSVSDNGRGISPEDLSKLFQKFVRLEEESQQTKRIVGTGLGLAVVKAIVEAHGGAIRAESQPGVGTRFLFTAPPA